MFGKKKENTRKWAFDYTAYFIDGSVENRTGFVEADYIANAVAKAEEMIDRRAENDQEIEETVFTCVCMEK